MARIRAGMDWRVVEARLPAIRRVVVVVRALRAVRVGVEVEIEEGERLREAMVLLLC